MHISLWNHFIRGEIKSQALIFSSGVFHSAYAHIEDIFYRQLRIEYRIHHTILEPVWGNENGHDLFESIEDRSNVGPYESGGWGGIRTHGPRLRGTLVFETSRISLSRTQPLFGQSNYDS